MKYRKKPVVIEAVHVPYNEYADEPGIWPELPVWLEEAWKAGVIYPKFKGEDYWYYYIKTLEGEMECSPDDYLIRGVQGELYPCKPDIFEATYEKVED